MSREIKFRNMVYREQHKDWVTYFYTLQDLVENSDMCVFEDVWEQYTGLKDKNGKEIYEGDIMEFGIAGAENRGVVGYEEDFGSYETYTSKGYIIAPLFTSCGKIIGNIHENPELLEDKDGEEK